MTSIVPPPPARPTRRRCRCFARRIVAVGASWSSSSPPWCGARCAVGLRPPRRQPRVGPDDARRASCSAVREASAITVIIGFVPEEVGNARRVADPDARRVVQLAARVRPRSAAGRAPIRQRAHLVRREQAQAAGAQRDPLHARDEAARGRRPRATSGDRSRQATICVRAGGHVGAHLRLDRRRRVGAGRPGRHERVPRHRLPVRVDRHAPVRRGRARARPRSRRLGSPPSPACAARRRVHGSAEAPRPGRVLHALDQEAVAVLGVRELVAPARLRRAPPRLHVLAVVADWPR